MTFRNDNQLVENRNVDSKNNGNNGESHPYLNSPSGEVDTGSEDFSLYCKPTYSTLQQPGPD